MDFVRNGGTFYVTTYTYNNKFEILMIDVYISTHYVMSGVPYWIPIHYRQFGTFIILQLFNYNLINLKKSLRKQYSFPGALFTTTDVKQHVQNGTDLVSHCFLNATMFYLCSSNS